ncbi:MAG: GNAT family N-acetyltransferase [Pseudomonadota bacterium]
MNSNDIRFRFATAEDQDVLAALMLESNRHYWGEDDNAVDMTAASADAMISGRSGCRAVLAFVADAPAGFATISVLHPALNEAGTLFMKDLFVSKAARGTGLGEVFMKYLARHAVDLGCQRFDWTAETDNERALEFYDRIGAARVEQKVYYRFTGPELTSFARSDVE